MEAVANTQALRELFLSVALLWCATTVRAQLGTGNLQSRTTQTDYAIISPPSYVSTIQPLANFRASRNGFSVFIARTDSIYRQFGQGIAPDSAINVSSNLH